MSTTTDPVYTFGIDTGSANATTTFTTTTTAGNSYWVYDTGTITTPQYVTYSGVYDPNSFMPRPVIKFGFYLRFKRSKAKLEKSWQDDTISFRIGSEESKLKKLL